MNRIPRTTTPPASQQALKEYLFNGSMKGSMKYWGLLPQLPSEVSVRCKTSQPGGHPVCLRILHSGDDTALRSSTFLLLNGSDGWPCPFHSWIPALPSPNLESSEPLSTLSWPRRRIFKMSVLSRLDDSNSLNAAASLSPLPMVACSQLGTNPVQKLAPNLSHL